jgi:hypothetical protein
VNDLPLAVQFPELNNVQLTILERYIAEQVSQAVWKNTDECFSVAASCFSEGKSYDKFLQKWSEMEATIKIGKEI